jgi:hypothetical protein
MAATPRILEEGKTPAQWVAEFADRNIEISERTLRAKARRLGAFCAVGNAMLIKPEHIDRIFEEASCPLNSTNADENGGSGVELTGLTDTSTEALEHLTKLSRKPSSGKLKGRRNNVHSLDRTRRQKKKS